MRSINVRLQEEQEQILDDLSARENRSKNDLILMAISEYGQRRAKSERTRASFDRIRARDAELLDLLSK